MGPTKGVRCNKLRNVKMISRIVRLASVGISAIALAFAAFVTTAPAMASSITIPDLTGQNAKIAQDKLETLGLTNVTLSSATTKYSMVLAPENWKVVSSEPAAGSVVSSSDDVILKVTKP
jgi:PASTA domain-containing protein